MTSKFPPALILVTFTAAIFVSALLLFGVQPMFTRMVLPNLGGSPSVWSVAMVFFQTMLLAGYAYAHYLMKAKRSAIVVGVHIVLIILAGLTLPLSIARGWGEPPSQWTALWLVGLFVVSIGLPFFALSANNPLLQAWFVRTGHPDGKDPYFLYAASNVGSFLALLSYPILLEPVLSLRSQTLVWTAGYWFLFALIAACAFLLLRSPDADGEVERAEPTPAPSWRSIGRWMFLAAVPSGLLVAVTAHISTDVAAAPLLWVVPLSLYLLTWVLVFQRRPLIPHRFILLLQPFAIVGLVGLLTFSTTSYLLIDLSGHLLAFFIIAMACHGELARQRPPAEHLTTFYVALSAGGMVGGLFAGLIAPFIFSWIAEYPILIVLAILCLPFPAMQWDRTNTIFWIVAVVLGVAILAPGLVHGWTPEDKETTVVQYAIVGIACIGVLLLFIMRAPFKFAFAVAIALTMIRLYPGDEQSTQTVRSFFGVHKLYETSDGQHRVLLHGTTVHGAQKIADEDGNELTGRPEPLTYYHVKSPMAQAIQGVRKRKGGPIKVAIIGLGAGTLACYIEPGDTWRFFEIDSSVVDIARDPNLFTYLSSCAPDVSIVLGDARLTLAREPDGEYDLIIVDAYSSDAIPIHLATREAMALYKSKLAPDGIVVMHVSNRHLDLNSVAVGIAAANGMKAWTYNDDEDEDRDAEYTYNSDVVIAAMHEEALGDMATNKKWDLTEPDEDQRVWTDDYSNVVGALWRKMDWPSWLTWSYWTRSKDKKD
jgi:hypothetical protein